MRQAGFTLVELLVVVAVTTLMAIVVTNYMMRNIQSTALDAAQATIQSEVQTTLDIVGNDIRLSASADPNNRNPDANSPVSGNPYGWTSSSSTLILATAAVNTSNQIIFSDATNYVTVKNDIIYFVSGGTLYKRTLAASVSGNKAKTSCPANLATSSCPADVALIHNVTNFALTYIDGDNNSVAPDHARSIKLSLTASRTQYKQTQSASYTTQMVFRND